VFFFTSSLSPDRILSLQESGFLQDLANSFFVGTQDKCGAQVQSWLHQYPFPDVFPALSLARNGKAEFIINLLRPLFVEKQKSVISTNV